ncbi:MAG: hypothetical protein DLM67_16970 [Candidatus Nephthysia bennettiae]|nr:MAG: hypothetical protein DLM67_16970 [Candidatus Dormibacteraeota bacterium]
MCWGSLNSEVLNGAGDGTRTGFPDLGTSTYNSPITEGGFRSRVAGSDLPRVQQYRLTQHGKPRHGRRP